MANLLKYYSYTFTNQQKRQVVGVVSTDPGDAWAQLGIKLGSRQLREGFAQSGAPLYLGEFPPGAKLTPRDQQIGQQ
jgi:hypothetical protein